MVTIHISSTQKDIFKYFSIKSSVMSNTMGSGASILSSRNTDGSLYIPAVVTAVTGALAITETLISVFKHVPGPIGISLALASFGATLAKVKDDVYGQDGSGDGKISVSNASALLGDTVNLGIAIASSLAVVSLGMPAAIGLVAVGAILTGVSAAYGTDLAQFDIDFKKATADVAEWTAAGINTTVSAVLDTLSDSWDWVDSLFSEIGPNAVSLLEFNLLARLNLNQSLMPVASLRDPRNSYNRLNQAFESAEATQVVRDPLVLDLDGDGIHTLDLAAGASFDFGGDGFREATGWVSAGDGFLVRDLNGNGVIDDGRELFGDQTVLPNGAIAEAGFQALASMDSNQDGVVDASDQAWAEILIWQDRNGDGISTVDELSTMSQAGVASISLAYTEPVAATMPNGNAVAQVGSFTRIDGSTGAAASLLFQRNLAASIPLTELAETSAVYVLPDLAGMGTAHSLHQAMLRDPQLQALVENFVGASHDQVGEAFDAVLLRWTGADATDPTRMRGAMKSNHLAVLERLMGRTFISSQGLSDPDVAQAAFLQSAYTELRAVMYGEALLQTKLSTYFNAMEISIGPDGPTNVDVSSVISHFKSAIASNIEEGMWLLSQFVNAMRAINLSESAGFDELYVEFSLPSDVQINFGGTNSENIVLSNQSNIVFGLGGNDIIAGGSADDIMFGGGGADTISGGGGSDLFVGGKGNDALIGGVNTDRYVFNLGDGADTIRDYGRGGDAIELGVGIQPEDLRLSASLNGKDLILAHVNGIDKITVLDYFVTSRYEYDNKVEFVLFSNGVIWDHVKLDGSSVITGTPGADTLTSTGMVDTTLIGGKGNDTLVGGVKADTYLFNVGDGRDTIRDYGLGVDTIKFGVGILSEDIQLSASTNGKDLVISHVNGTDRITVLDYFVASRYEYDNKIEQVLFADGSTWDRAKLDSGAVIIGTAGNDTLTASASVSTTLIGGKGNDSLVGGMGADTYVFELGDGLDTIRDYGLAGDVIKFGEGVNPADLALSASLNGKDLVIAHVNGTDKVTILDYFVPSSYSYDNRIEQVQFHDGTLWDRARLDSGAVITGSSGNDTLTSTGAVDTTLIGGTGNDTLTGSYKADTYVFNIGDGVDTIRDYGLGGDIIKFGAGVRAADVALSTSASGKDLLITYGLGTDKITVLDYFVSSRYDYNNKVERLQFHDGSVQEISAILAAPLAAPLIGINVLASFLYTQDASSIHVKNDKAASDPLGEQSSATRYLLSTFAFELGTATQTDAEHTSTASLQDFVGRPEDAGQNGLQLLR